MSMADRDGKIWMDGELVDWRDAKIHVLTHTLHYGCGAFEGVRAYNTVAGTAIFRLREHTERLLASGRILGFDIPWTAEQIDAACIEVLAANGLSDGYVRPIAWRGTEQLSVSAQQTRIHLAIACWAWPNLFGADRMAGVRLGMAPWRRPPPECAPTNSKAAGLYMTGTLSKHAAEAAGFNDALMLDHRGKVAEATGANIFFVKDGDLHTPKVEGFLDGITRRTVMSIARRHQVKVVERVIEEHEMAGFSEVFLTGTAAEVTPVREIQGMSFTPGRVTETLLRDYEALVRMSPAEVARLAA